MQVNAIDLMLKVSGSPVYAIGRARLRFPSLSGISAFDEPDYSSEKDACLNASEKSSGAPAENQNISSLLVSAAKMAADDFGSMPAFPPTVKGSADDSSGIRKDLIGNEQNRQLEANSPASGMRSIFPSDGTGSNPEMPRLRSSSGGFSPKEFIAAVEKSRLSSCFAPSAAPDADQNNGAGSVGAFSTDYAASAASFLPDSLQGNLLPCVVMLGKMPPWASDLEFALGGIRLFPAGSQPAGTQAVAAICLGNAESDAACEIPMIRASGKKSLWKSLIAAGLVRRRER